MLQRRTATGLLLFSLLCGVVASQTVPPLDFWLKAIKNPLTAPDAEEVWNTTFKDAIMAGQQFPYLEGTVVSIEQTADGPKVLLAMEGDGVANAALLFNGRPCALKSEPELGTTVKFVGVAKSFTREPFMITFWPIELQGLEAEPGKGYAPTRCRVT